MIKAFYFCPQRDNYIHQNPKRLGWPSGSVGWSAGSGGQGCRFDSRMGTTRLKDNYSELMGPVETHCPQYSPIKLKSKKKRKTKARYAKQGNI